MDFFDYIKSNKIIITIISIIFNIISVIIIIFLIVKQPKCECKICSYDKQDKSESVSKATYKIEVKGAVKHPSVVELEDGSVINDAIVMVGGFNKDAYTQNINLSRKIKDEMVIYVYTKKDYKNKLAKLKTKSVKTVKEIVEVMVPVESTCDCSSYEITNCKENLSSEIISSNIDTNFNNNTTANTNNNDSNDSDSISDKININTATKEELLTLTGIGESKAKDIISYRTNNRFVTIEDIKNVKGIGDAIFEKIKEYITV
jgi:competence protein ComEA